VSEPNRTLAGPPVGRHAAAVSLTIVVMLVFCWLDGDRGGQSFDSLSHRVLLGGFPESRG
jgi:hypothetical protein